MNIILLTHERELLKSSNTGCLVKEVLLDTCELVVWKRKEPDEAFVSLLATKQAVLLFPFSELPTIAEADNPVKPIIASESSDWTSAYRYFVILDSTWQQAKKMYRQSPYLQTADKLALDEAPPSVFQRRRNQREGGLCTAECVIELLRLGGKEALAKLLEARYIEFNENL